MAFTELEQEILRAACRWHRNKHDPSRCSELNTVSVRVGLPASTLRVTDAMDIDHRLSG